MRALVALMALAILPFVAGCDLFATRDPEPPDAGSGPPFLQPDRAEIVVSNLRGSIQGMNTANYLRCLDEDSFVFEPAPRDTDADIWPGWSFDSERLYFDNLRAATQGLTGHQLQLADESTQDIPGGGIRFTARYTLTVNHNRSTQGVPTIARGTMVLDLFAGENGLWAIHMWTDRADGEVFSWSDMKSTFSRD
jgi:hypothetical protein